MKNTYQEKYETLMNEAKVDPLIKKSLKEIDAVQKIVDDASKKVWDKFMAMSALYRQTKDPATKEALRQAAEQIKGNTYHYLKKAKSSPKRAKEALNDPSQFI